jgi:DNA invertase Pin-like site-specific DNA recombinase
MKCAIYARVSTKDKGQDVENQLIQQRRYTTAQGWEITEFIDHETGKHANRPQFQALFAAASRREMDVVLVRSIDSPAKGSPRRSRTSSASWNTVFPSELK